jgi:antitoxin HicB
MPYPVTLVRDDTDDAGWVATIDALPGCTARGATPNEALDGASAAMAEWLETAKREGKDVPEPKTSQSHSGRLLLRMPQSLHAELSRAAERENVSLNQFITDALAGALGWRAPARKAHVTRAAPIEGDGTVEPRAAGDPRGTSAGSQKRSRFSSTVFVVNCIIVGVAALVAIVVLVAALTHY